MRSLRSVLFALVAPACVALTAFGAIPTTSNPSDNVQAAALVNGPENIDTVGTLDDDCQRGDAPGVEFQKCWEQVFADVARTQGIAAALIEVHRQGRDNPRVLGICHDFKHTLGRIGLELHGTPSAALRFDDLACQYGYRHGVLEAFAEAADDAQMSDTMSRLCDELPQVSTGGSDLDSHRERGECLHALGHAAAVYVPDDVYAALDWCLLTGEDSASREGCAGGAFMEYGNSYINQNTQFRIGTSEHGPGNSRLSHDDARFLCERVRAEFTAECWLRINMFWGPELGDSIGEMLKRCGDEAADWRETCARSTGEWTYRMAHMAQPSEGGVAAAVHERCRDTDPQVEGNCLFGVVLPMRGSDIWGEVPVGEWPLICEGASSAESGEICFTGERQAILTVPDDAVRERLFRARGFDVYDRPVG